jgi:P-type conjugative transfer protein TrbJ
MRHRSRAALTLGTAALALSLSAPVRAQWIVFDPTNYAQNVLTAARELEQVDNEVKALENQATMLVNQGKNLASLPYSSLATLEQSIGETEQLLSQAQQIGYDISAIDQAFSQLYPKSYSRSTSSTALLADAQTRWRNARAGYQDAMRIQAGVVQSLAITRGEIGSLVAASQSAQGSLQATQSGNQLIALETKQLSDLTAVMASLARAQSLSAARTLETEAEAREQRARFLNYGSGYRPGSARMFH